MDFYLVQRDWVDRWMSFLKGQGADPGPIDNKHVYKQYFVYNEEIKLSEDYYLFTGKLWRFLFTIYGGGPVIKKFNQNQVSGKVADFSYKREIQDLLDDNYSLKDFVDNASEFSAILNEFNTNP